jgi:hypothetical protein
MKPYVTRAPKETLVQELLLLGDQRVPAHLRDRYPTYEEYRAAIHDFLNAN